MPVRKTSYKVEAPPEQVSSLPQPTNIRPADTTLIDDLATLLAYCLIADVTLKDGVFDPAHQKALKPHLLGSNTSARLSLMVALASGLGIAAESQGALRAVPANA